MRAVAVEDVDGRDVGDGFTALDVTEIVREGTDAVSLVLAVPTRLASEFSYRAGQFLTLKVTVNGTEHRRNYSMSSSPLGGADLRITVKRDGAGVVSNWINDHVEVGDRIHAARPAGHFVLTESDREIVAFAGGSGVTPVFSLVTTALAGTTRATRLLYANRSRDSVIFADALRELIADNPERCSVEHHWDEDSGVLTADKITAFVAGAGDADYYICGPAPFMDAVEAALVAAAVPPGRIHLERFTVAVPSDSTAATSETVEVTIELGGSTTTVAHRPGRTLLQTARSAGLRAPSSCETGSCGTCIARVVEGSATMLNNDALDDDEVEAGLIVTCQSLPTSPTIKVIYE